MAGQHVTLTRADMCAGLEVLTCRFMSAPPSLLLLRRAMSQTDKLRIKLNPALHRDPAALKQLASATSYPIDMVRVHLMYAARTQLCAHGDMGLVRVAMGCLVSTC
jgi:hypothetical protein